jgi:hypothetical protein
LIFIMRFVYIAALHQSRPIQEALVWYSPWLP